MKKTIAIILIPLLIHTSIAPMKKGTRNYKTRHAARMRAMHNQPTPLTEQEAIALLGSFIYRTITIKERKMVNNKKTKKRQEKAITLTFYGDKAYTRPTHEVFQILSHLMGRKVEINSPVLSRQMRQFRFISLAYQQTQNYVRSIMNNGDLIPMDPPPGFDKVCLTRNQMKELKANRTYFMNSLKYRNPWEIEQATDPELRPIFLRDIRGSK